MKIPKWVWGVLVGVAVIGQVLHWMALARVDARLKALTGEE